MEVSSWLKQAEDRLNRAGISTARLDCLVLLEDETGKDRGWLLAHPEHELQGSEIKTLSTKIAQRAQHVPLAYIRGKAEFYGHEFIVNAHTLVPRPETETIIELLQYVRNQEASLLTWDDGGRRRAARRQRQKQATPPQSELVQKPDGTYAVEWRRPVSKKPAPTPPARTSPLSYHDEDLWLVDVGTGSGAIAITAKLELPEAEVTAIDIDRNCLETAQRNAANLHADGVTFLKGNLLEPIKDIQSDKTLVLLCNLPYVPDNFQINTAATHEPRHALFGGPDGLDLYRDLFMQANSLATKPIYILCESLPPQHEVLAEIAEANSYYLHKTEDFIQLFQTA